MAAGDLIKVEIDKEGKVRLSIISNDPKHGDLLEPFENIVSNGNAKLVEKHRCDHSHSVGHTHSH